MEGNWSLLLSRMASWQKTQFPKTTTVGALNHLRKELEELTDSPADPEEWADVLHLAIQGGVLSAGSLGKFMVIVNNKLIVNERKRDWPTEPNADNVYEHDRTDKQNELRSP